MFFALLLYNGTLRRFGKDMKRRLFTSIVIVMAAVLLRPNACNGETYAYVANGEEGSVSIVDALKHSVLGKISNVAVGPVGLAVSPAGNYVFVADQEDPKISVIKTENNRVYKEIDLPDDSTPQGVAVSTDGKFLYVVAGRGTGLDGVLYVVNTGSGDLVGQASVGKDPVGVIAFSKAGSYYSYVANRGSGTVSVIENRGKLEPIRDAGESPSGISVSPDLNYIYVTNPDADTVSVLPAVGAEVFIQEPVLDDAYDIGDGPSGVTVVSMGEDRHHVFVTNQNDASLTVLAVQTDDVTHTVIDSTRIESNSVHWFSEPYGIAATPNGEYVYVTNRGNDTVSVVETAENLTDNAVIDTVYVGQGPTSFGRFVGRVPPNTPTELTVTAEAEEQIRLEWIDNSSDELGFEIDRKVEGEENYSLLHTAASNVEAYNDTEVLEMQTYYYRIRAFNEVGDSGYASGQAGTSLHGPVKLRAIRASTNSVTLQWEDRSGFEAGFEIERRVVPKPTSYNADADDDDDDAALGTTSTDGDDDRFTKVATVGADVTRYTDKGLQSNTTYVYRVRAYQNDGTSGTFTLAGEETDPSTYSAYSNEVEADTSEDYLCFIGTAACGFPGEVSHWMYFGVCLIGGLFFCSGMFFLLLQRQEVSIHISKYNPNRRDSRRIKRYFNSPCPKTHLS